ncbi:hypothetical protein QVD17_31692 [Tagetes erecta]|uniref:Uncharacterized protein n=1 Tax=Tagetes erecta TaxID=13708 RepID=A0AAD8K4Z4_TARER|nr:hypothetical protein QVD17_31692 [Tagetes erecta]
MVEPGGRTSESGGYGPPHPPEHPPGPQRFGPPSPMPQLHRHHPPPPSRPHGYQGYFNQQPAPPSLYNNQFYDSACSSLLTAWYVFGKPLLLLPVEPMNGG